MSTCDLIVVGTSPAGVALALDAARQGQEVLLFTPPCPPDEDAVARALAHRVRAIAQAHALLPSLCVAPGQADFATLALQVRQSITPAPLDDRPATLRVIDRAVRFTAPGVLSDGQEEYRASRVVLDLGRELLKPAEVQGLIDAPALTGASLLDAPGRPARLAVLGAGRHGVQLAQTMALLGSQVHLVDREPHVLPRMDPKLADIALPVLEAADVTLHLGVSVLRVSHRDQRFTLRFADERELIVDALVLATGTRPRTGMIDPQAGHLQTDSLGHLVVNARYETNVEGVHAIGGCIDAPRRDDLAAEDAQRLSDLWQGLKRRAGDRPRVLTVHTTPPIVQIGLTPDEAELAGYRLDQVATQGDDGDPLGLLVDEPSGKLLGATLRSPDAADLTPLLATLIAQGRPWRDLLPVHHVEGSPAWRLQALACQLDRQPSAV